MRYLVVLVWTLKIGLACVWAEESVMDPPFLVQAIQAQKEYDYGQAQALFEQYINTLPNQEQALYLDMAYVASRRDLKVYERISDAEKDEVKRRFWTRTDPSPLTRVNERLIEHYRRVAYARTNFGQGRFPWDDRGEVYVRFGEPDHMSSSNDLQIEMDRDVQDARDNFVRRKRVHLQVTPGQPIFPIPKNTWWTYWVYTNLDRGIEFAFIRRFKKTVYEFPPIPDGLGVGLTADLMGYQGQMVLNDLVSRKPWVYDVDFSQLPIDFFYYPAAFRGKEGQTRLEIYYGLPASEMARLPLNEKTDRILLDRGLAIFDSVWVEQHRVHDQLTFHMPSQKQILDNAFIPGVMTFDVKPGSNYLALQVRDVVSGKSQVYQ
ncbi:MAG: GWxTD domain-containing protein, partial [Candidatus Latescibacteria bacterium]|nr:GWxTD domain-containing protein [Candidatus Latescibacterota bacterium]